MTKNLTKNSSKAGNKMTKWGVSPKMFLILLPFIIFFSLLHFIYYPLFILPVQHIWMIIIGIALNIIGFAIYLKSIKVINKAFANEQLLTTGVYGHMRHPLYSAFILFIIPGIAFLFNSWILFFIPITYYLIFRILIKEEEDYCLNKFGEKYTHYKKKVFAIFPKLRKYKPL